MENKSNINKKMTKPVIEKIDTKKKQNIATYWWLRTPYIDYYIISVAKYGTMSDYTSWAAVNYGISPAFRIG